MALQGRRLSDTVAGSFPLEYDKLLPGDIWKKLNTDGTPMIISNYPTNLTQRSWMVIAPGPNGLKLFANLEAHTVREHDDGTISVRPGDGSSNSILVSRLPDEMWHGYIEHNEWREC